MDSGDHTSTAQHRLDSAHRLPASAWLSQTSAQMHAQVRLQFEFTEQLLAPRSSRMTATQQCSKQVQETHAAVLLQIVYWLEICPTCLLGRVQLQQPPTEGGTAVVILQLGQDAHCTAKRKGCVVRL